MRTLISLSLIALVSTAAFAGAVPSPYKNKNSYGQEYTVTFKPDGTISAISTCKSPARDTNPSCRLVDSGRWTEEQPGIVCWTYATWSSRQCSAVKKK